MNTLPDCVVLGEWPDRFGNYAPMNRHNRKQWALTPAEEIAVWRGWFNGPGGPGQFWNSVGDIEAELGRSDD